MSQVTLFDLPVQEAPRARRPARRSAKLPVSSAPKEALKPHTDSLEAQFVAFDRANPEVYLWFRKYALELLFAGHAHGGAKAIVERIRWEVALKYPGRDLKINNNHTAFYARKLAQEDRRFRHFFKFRLQKAVCEAE